MWAEKCSECAVGDEITISAPPSVIHKEKDSTGVDHPFCIAIGSQDSCFKKRSSNEVKISIKQSSEKQPYQIKRSNIVSVEPFRRKTTVVAKTTVSSAKRRLPQREEGLPSKKHQAYQYSKLCDLKPRERVNVYAIVLGYWILFRSCFKNDNPLGIPPRSQHVGVIMSCL